MENLSGEASLFISETRNSLLASQIAKYTIEKTDGRETWLDWRDTKGAQAEADEIYSPEYEADKKKLDASVDIKGRPVTYFRSMSIEAFLTILKKGEITPLDYHNKFSQDDLSALRTYLADYRRFLKYEAGELYSPKDFAEADQMTIEELAYEVFPTADKEEVDGALFRGLDTDWNTLLDFLDRHMDVNYIKGRHAGGVMKRFSPFLSLSVATPREASVYSSVIVEFVIPDGILELNKLNGAVGEREMLAKKLRSVWIARVFIDDPTYQKDFVYNKSSTVGSFNADPNNKELIRRRGNPVEAFRWDVPIEETLPVPNL